MPLSAEEQQYYNRLMGDGAVKKATQDYSAEPDMSVEDTARQYGAGNDVDQIKQDQQKEKMNGALSAIKVPPSPSGEASKAVGNPGKGILMGLADMAQTAYNGGIDLVNWVGKSASLFGVQSGDVIDQSNKVDWSAKLALPDDAIGTRAFRTATKYAAPIVATMGAGAAIGAGEGASAIASMGVQGMSDFLLLDPRQERLSDMVIKEVPELKNFPVAYNIVNSLAHKPGESEFASRFKNAIEGAVIGAPIAGAWWGISKFSNAASKAGVDIERGLVDGKIATPSEVEAAKVASEGEVAASEAKMGENATLQGDLFDYARTQATPEGGTKFNLNNTEVVDYAREFAKANPEGDFSRGPKSFAELDAQAKAVLTNKDQLDKLLSWRLGDRPLTDAETKASQYLMRNSADAVMDAAEKAVQSGKPEDLLHFQNMVDTHSYINNVREGAGSEAGRALNAHKLAAEMAGMSVEDFNKMLTKDNQKQLIDDAIKFSGGQKNVEDLAKSVVAIKQLGPEEAAAKIAAKSKEAIGNTQRLGVLLKTTAINGMLSSPKTAVANFINNAITASKQVMDNYISAGIGTIRGTQNATTFAQANSYLGNMLGSTLEGFKAMGQALRGQPAGPANIIKADLANYPKLMSDAMQIPIERSMGYKIIGNIADAYGLAVGLPSRLSATHDAFWGTVAYRGKLGMMATEAAEQQGLKGAEASAFIENFKANPTAEVHEQAKQFAQDMTFARRLDPDSWAGQVDSLIDKTPGGKVVFPFFKTTANIVSYNINNSPLGLLLPQSKTWDAIRAGGAAADMAVAKVASGSAFLGIAAYLSSAGMYSGPDTRNPKIRQALEETGQGWQPDSMKFNDSWFNIHRMDYVHTIMNLGHVIASTANYINKDEYQQLASIGATAIADVMTPEMMVETYSQYMDAFSQLVKGQDAGKAMTQVGAQIAGSVLPLSALQRDVRAQVDPYKSDTTTPTKGDAGLQWLTNLTDKIAAKYQSVNPWLSDKLPIERNMFGEPLLVPFGSLDSGMEDKVMNFLSPYASQKKENTPIVKTLADMAGFQEQMGPINPDMPKLPISMPSRMFTLKGISVPLDRNEYEKYVMYSAGLDPKTGKGVEGQTLRDELSTVVNAIRPNLKVPMDSITYGKLVGAVSKVILKYRKIGQAMMAADPDIMAKWNKAFDAQRQLQDFSGIGE